MRTILSSFLLASVVACTGPSRTITPVGPDGWGEAIGVALESWTQAVGPCELPTEIGLDGDEIRLVDPGEWSHGDGVVGWTYDSGAVDILGPSLAGRDAILLHELGHRWGLADTDAHADVMYRSPQAHTPSASDIDNLRNSLGCL